MLQPLSKWAMEWNKITESKQCKFEKYKNENSNKKPAVLQALNNWARLLKQKMKQDYWK